MRKHVFSYLLAIVGAVLLAGIISSCGDSPEPRFKIIESREYTDITKETVGDALKLKHTNKPTISNAGTIMATYWDDVDSLVIPQMQKKSPTAAGLFMVLKIDQYMYIGWFEYDNDGQLNGQYNLYDY